MELLPHQTRNVTRLIRSLTDRRFGLDASDTGTGKTITALAVAREMRRRPVVICPLSVGPAWVAKANSMSTAADDSAAASRAGGSSSVDWINYERVRPNKKAEAFIRAIDPDNDLVILDEAHRVSAPDTLTAKLAKRIVDLGVPVLAASATPFSTPLKTRWFLHAAGITRWAAWYDALPEMGCYRHKSLKGRPWLWDNNPAVIASIRDALSDSMVATRWTEVDGFASRTVQPVAVTTSIKPAAINELRAAVEERGLGATTQERVRLEQARVASMVDMTRDLLATGHSVVAAFNFTAPLLEYAETFDAHVIHGKTPVAARAHVVEQFQRTDHPRIVAINSQAGGEGIDLLSPFPTVSLISPPYDARTLLQVIGRTHRIGAHHPAICRILFAAGSVEEHSVMPKVQAAAKNLETLKDTTLL